MKKLVALSLLFSFSSFAEVPMENIECFSDMSDGACEMKEANNSYKVHCTIDVMLTLKSGEKVQAQYEGKSNVKKNMHAVFMNDVVKEKAVTLANTEMYQKIQPFFSMKSCN